MNNEPFKSRLNLKGFALGNACCAQSHQPRRCLLGGGLSAGAGAGRGRQRDEGGVQRPQLPAEHGRRKSRRFPNSYALLRYLTPKPSPLRSTTARASRPRSCTISCTRPATSPPTRTSRPTRRIMTLRSRWSASCCCASSRSRSARTTSVSAARTAEWLTCCRARHRRCFLLTCLVFFALRVAALAAG